jgi:hypothetical protein
MEAIIKIIKAIINFFYNKKNNIASEKKQSNMNITEISKTKVISELPKQPYKFRKNNRKLTKARLKTEKNQKVQSIPIYSLGKFIGYKYIFHK